MQNSWFSTLRLQNSCLLPYTQPWSELNRANSTRLLQSNKVWHISFCKVQSLVKMICVLKHFFPHPIYSSEEAEWAVQIQCGILPLTQHPPGALLFQEAPFNGPNHLHHGWATAVQPHCADGKSEEKLDRWEAGRRRWVLVTSRLQHNHSDTPCVSEHIMSSSKQLKCVYGENILPLFPLFSFLTYICALWSHKYSLIITDAN